VIYEVSQQFYFDSAHTLERSVEADPSRRVHGHTYHAEITVAGQPSPATGMVVDLGQVREVIERVRDMLDHRMLNEVEGLGTPTLENLCAFLWRQFEAEGCKPHRITVRRDAIGDACSLTDGRK
jgi:6-pyruvoyltetrahydropterin/6-carboxytetrahydropterin synthase